LYARQLLHRRIGRRSTLGAKDGKTRYITSWLQSLVAFPPWAEVADEFSG
jgi:hypothetical protein